MENEHRDRSAGWHYAKLSGHENERLLDKIVKNDHELQKRILKIAHKDGIEIRKIEFGGLNETNVPSIFGGTTKSKTDMCIHLVDDSRVNISIKKSIDGQVYLINPDRFIAGFETHYNTSIPSDVKHAISLYWGTADDTLDIIKQIGSKQKTYERRKHRLVANTLGQYNKALHESLITWFGKHIPEIFDFCFSRGLASNPEDWADIIWYRNELHENSIDRMFNIHDMKSLLPRSAEYGTRTGGSTIQLPFGTVQWHSPTKKTPGDMQFRHNYEKLADLYSDR